jgi:uncharacterized protein YdeI (YjbR/CyaY-like superfamily)
MFGLIRETSMPNTDPRVDAYIAKAGDFAQPVLNHLRAVVHTACPGVEETMKWSFPHFMYGGAILCSMAAFKAHCAFGFWKAELLMQKGEANNEAMGQFGRIVSLAGLPPKKTLTAIIKQAMKLNEEGVKVPSRERPKVARPLTVPDYFQKALAKKKATLAMFETFPTGQKREYVDWLEEAKTDATRARRLETALEWIAEGKKRNWKYENC